MGVIDLCNCVGIVVIKWDMVEIVYGGLFFEILQYDIFLNCILVSLKIFVFVQLDVIIEIWVLLVIGDIVCDLSSVFNLIKVYDWIIIWDDLVFCSCDDLLLDVIVIDNLLLMLLMESSEDYVSQFLLYLFILIDIGLGVWVCVKVVFDEYV